MNRIRRHSDRLHTRPFLIANHIDERDSSRNRIQSDVFVVEVARARADHDCDRLKLHESTEQTYETATRTCAHSVQRQRFVILAEEIIERRLNSSKIKISRIVHRLPTTTARRRSECNNNKTLIDNIRNNSNHFGIQEPILIIMFTPVKQYENTFRNVIGRKNSNQQKQTKTFWLKDSRQYETIRCKV